MKTAAERQRPRRGRARAGTVLILALSVAACTRAWVASPPPGPIDSPRFAERAGRPDYATTIRYIDDHVRYEDLDTGFAIGPTGDMCYAFEPGLSWCIPPKAVGYVGMDRYVEVHCSKWYPYCAYKVGRGAAATRERADQVQVREPFEDRARLVAAFRHLLRLMGGPDLAADPFAAKDAAPGG